MIISEGLVAFCGNLSAFCFFGAFFGLIFGACSDDDNIGSILSMCLFFISALGLIFTLGTMALTSTIGIILFYGGISAIVIFSVFTTMVKKMWKRSRDKLKIMTPKMKSTIARDDFYNRCF